MSQTLSKLSGKGRKFIDKHVLRNTPAPVLAQPQAPVRPMASAPVAPPIATRSTPPTAPKLPPAPTRQAPTPVRPVANTPRSGDQLGNDSPDPDDLAPVRINATTPRPASNDSASRGGPLDLSQGSESSSSETAPPQANNSAPPLGRDYGASMNTAQGVADSSSESSESSSESSSEESADNPKPGYTTDLGNGLKPEYLGNLEQVVGDDDSSSSEDSSNETELPGEEEAAPVVQRANRAVTPAEGAANTYMKTKQAPEKYDGEFNTRSFREQNAGSKQRTDAVTRVYSEEEQRQNELVMDEKGKFKRGDVSVAGQTGLGYTMDATGRMVAFKEYERTMVTKGPNGETRAEAVTSDINRIAPNQRFESTHHTSALGADEIQNDGTTEVDESGRPMLRSRPAAAAGTIAFNSDGTISKISNNSGHYAPTVEYLAQAIEHLMMKGAFFKNEVVDSSGRQLNPQSKEFALYDGIGKKLAAAGELRDKLTAKSNALQTAEQKGQADKMATLQKDLDLFGAQLEDLTTKVDQAQAVLRKLGVGPSNRIRQDALAEYIDIKPKMTPQEIKDAGDNPERANVDQFLRSGGGNREQLAQKGKVHEEMTKEISEGTKKAMEAVQTKLRDALTQDETAELETLTKQFQAARAAEWAEKDKQEKQRLRQGLAERRDELRDEATKGELSKEDAKELEALDKELNAQQPARQAPDAPPLSDKQKQRMRELREKLNSVLSKEDMAMFVARKKRAQVAGGNAAADAAAEIRAAKTGGGQAPDVDGALRAVNVFEPENILFNIDLPDVDDNVSEWSDSESEDEGSVSESGEDADASQGP
jgi:hypothetical protein